MFDPIEEVQPGDSNTAEKINEIIARANETFSAGDYHEDVLGRLVFPNRRTKQQVRHFELKDAHSPGDTTTAHPQDWSGSAWVTDTNENREFDVTDQLEIYRGRGKDDFDSPHDEGSKGVARLNSQSGEWEIVQLQPAAMSIEGTIATDDTLEAEDCHVKSPVGGIIVDQDPAGNITFTNPHQHEDINEGMLVTLDWDESIPGWTEVQKDCP